MPFFSILFHFYFLAKHIAQSDKMTGARSNTTNGVK